MAVLSLLIRIVAWIFIGFGGQYLLRRMFRLSFGRSSLTKPGARREAWLELGKSFRVVTGGLWLLAVLGRRFGAFWWLGFALVWASLIIPETTSWIRTRRKGKPGGEIGADAEAG